MYAILLIVVISAASVVPSPSSHQNKQYTIPKECMEEIQSKYALHLQISRDQPFNHAAIMKEVMKQIDLSKCTNVEFKMLWDDDADQQKGPDPREPIQGRVRRQHVNQTQYKSSELKEVNDQITDGEYRGANNDNRRRRNNNKLNKQKQRPGNIKRKNKSDRTKNVQTERYVNKDYGDNYNADNSEDRSTNDNTYRRHRRTHNHKVKKQNKQQINSRHRKRVSQYQTQDMINRKNYDSYDTERNNDYYRTTFKNNSTRLQKGYVTRAKSNDEYIEDEGEVLDEEEEYMDDDYVDEDITKDEKQNIYQKTKNHKIQKHNLPNAKPINFNSNLKNHQSQSPHISNNESFDDGSDAYYETTTKYHSIKQKKTFEVNSTNHQEEPLDETDDYEDDKDDYDTNDTVLDNQQYIEHPVVSDGNNHNVNNSQKNLNNTRQIMTKNRSKIVRNDSSNITTFYVDENKTAKKDFKKEANPTKNEKTYIHEKSTVKSNIYYDTTTLKQNVEKNNFTEEAKEKKIDVDNIEQQPRNDDEFKRNNDFKRNKHQINQETVTNYSNHSTSTAKSITTMTSKEATAASKGNQHVLTGNEELTTSFFESTETIKNIDLNHKDKQYDKKAMYSDKLSSHVDEMTLKPIVTTTRENSDVQYDDLNKLAKNKVIEKHKTGNDSEDMFNTAIITETTTKNGNNSTVNEFDKKNLLNEGQIDDDDDVQGYSFSGNENNNTDENYFTSLFTYDSNQNDQDNMLHRIFKIFKKLIMSILNIFRLFFQAGG